MHITFCVILCVFFFVYFHHISCFMYFMFMCFLYKTCSKKHKYPFGQYSSNLNKLKFFQISWEMLEQYMVGDTLYRFLSAQVQAD